MRRANLRERGLRQVKKVGFGMAVKENVRPGGRSARVQASVHAAVRALLAEMSRPEITVPLIAARAGVTPSTIYRRWGDLQELLGPLFLLASDASSFMTGSIISVDGGHAVNTL